MTDRPPVSGEPSTEASVDYAVHLMENMLRSAAPYHKPFIEQHIANVRALAEARATPPSLAVTANELRDAVAEILSNADHGQCRMAGEHSEANCIVEGLLHRGYTASRLTSKEERP